jgi:CRISPR-associated protein Cas2
MRLLVFFDLPQVSSSDRRDYSKFRKLLIYNGFIMHQESVYVKLALNRSIITSTKLILRNNCPKKGILEILELTEIQYSKIEFIIGELDTKVINSTKRIVNL